MFVFVMLSGVMGCIAGDFYSIGYLGMYTSTIIGGRGWIAFAICFLGNWNPIGAFIGTLVFGLAESFAILMQASKCRNKSTYILIFRGISDYC